MNNTEQKNVIMRKLTSEELEFVSGGGPVGWVKDRVSSGAKAVRNYTVKLVWDAYRGYQYIRRFVG